jgi:hypothetical protein
VNYIKIDGVIYQVPYVDVQRQADVLDKYAERTEDGSLRREIIGVYYNYSITFGEIFDQSLYFNLYNKLTEPTAFHTIEVPGTNAVYRFTGYISSVKDALYRIKDGKPYWKELSARFIAKEPARKP